MQQICNSCDMPCPIYSSNKWLRETIDDMPQNWLSLIAHDPPTSLCFQSIRCKKKEYIKRGIFSITRTAIAWWGNSVCKCQFSKCIPLPTPPPDPPPPKKKQEWINTDGNWSVLCDPKMYYENCNKKCCSNLGCNWQIFLNENHRLLPPLCKIVMLI